MSVLVISTGRFFAARFLSWPIAVVLTLVLLVGHWGVTQLADVNTQSLGSQVVTDFKFTDAAVSAVVSSSVNALAQVLNAIGSVLPDVTQFAAIEDVAQGQSLPGSVMADSP